MFLYYLPLTPFSDKDINIFTYKINIVLDEVITWFQRNKLSGNIDKTKCMIYHFEQVIPNRFFSEHQWKKIEQNLIIYIFRQLLWWKKIIGNMIFCIYRIKWLKYGHLKRSDVILGTCFNPTLLFRSVFIYALLSHYFGYYIYKFFRQNNITANKG